jgi:hypothetical protein
MFTTRIVIVGVVLVMTLGLTIESKTSPAAMASAGAKFLASLTPEQRKQATFPFDSSERMRWHFIPTESYPRNGLTIKQMTAAQRALAHDLLKAGLSQRGYMTATQIMDAESFLATLEAAQRAAAANPPRGTPLVRDPERYFFSVFGEPSPRGTWGWRAEGHHMSLHWTIVNGQFVAGSPTFFGSNPAEIREGPRQGTRILALEEDAARAVVESLDEAQRTKAIINTAAPNDIVTMANVTIDPLSPTGIAWSELSAAQRGLLTKLVEVYTGRMSSEIAAGTHAKIEKAGWDKVTFAWAGSLERGQRHYYRVQGPTFLIEYDNTQNNANHVHAVWRDFKGDFGADLLREHVRGTPH